MKIIGVGANGTYLVEMSQREITHACGVDAYTARSLPVGSHVDLCEIVGHVEKVRQGRRDLERTADILRKLSALFESEVPALVTIAGPAPEEST